MTTAVSAVSPWAHPWARPQAAPARPDAWRRAAGTWHEPNAWTVGILLTTSVLVMARHPIARALGTEVPAAPTVTTSAPSRPHPVVNAPTLAVPVVSAPTHAPRDPFRALVTAGGKVLAPAEINPTRATPVPVPTVSSCTGTSHRVVAGDTLWTLAARAVGTSASGRVTVAWHRLYDANRAVVGADPSVLRVGVALCVPQSL